MSTVNRFNVANMTSAQRGTIRSVMTDHYEYLLKVGDDYATSNAITVQFIETALFGLDAVQRMEDLAAKFEKDAENAGGAGIVAKAIATEIRNALKGI